MKKEIELRKLYSVTFIVLFFSLFYVNSIAAKWWRETNVKLSLESQSMSERVATLKLVVSHPANLVNADIYCLIPDGLELINDNNYNIIYSQMISGESVRRVTFYSGPFEGGRKMEFVFKVRITDDKKYLITAWGGDNYDTLELDLGDPEPPALEPNSQATTKVTEAQKQIETGMKQSSNPLIVELAAPVDSLPPLRTELRIRTKERPSGIEFMNNPKGPVPFRYLVYTENESSKVEAHCILPPEFEIVDSQNYETSQDAEGNTIVLLYSGSMRFKECKAFYFKVKRKKGTAIKDGSYLIKTEAALFLANDEKITKADAQSISFGRIEY